MVKNSFNIDTLFQDILPFVIKPARYVGGELNAVQKDPENIKLRVALAFPEIYEIGMSYLGFGILYHILNKSEHIWAERVFAPWPDMEKELRRHGIPLYTLESFTPLSRIDLIGFTLQYELTYTNILNMLDLAGIPVFARDRKTNDPLVIAGGPCTCNPEPVADFFDVVFTGDGEEGFPELCEAVIRMKESGVSRQEMLAALKGIEGVYIPCFYEVRYAQNGWFERINPGVKEAPARIHTRVVKELKSTYYPDKPVVPLIDVTHNRLSIEVMRGCTQGCRFCNAGMIYRPVRERDHREIVEQTRSVLPETGYEEVSFVSLSISDYSELPALLCAESRLLEDMQVNFSFPSMRLDSFSEELADYASNIRKSGFTFAPESGSARLRKVINKNISDDDLFRSVDIALKKGWRILKFYFMIGLPTETKEDVEALILLMERVVERSRLYGRVRFNVSISTFSPKSHTPFQWEAQDSEASLKEKITLIRSRLAGYKQIKLSWRDTDVSLLECVLGRGDRRVAQTVYYAWKKGARFDGWSDYFDIRIWEETFRDAGLQMSMYAGVLSTEKPLPWDHIHKGVSRSFLLKERTNAWLEKTTQDCRTSQCYGCGVQRKDGRGEPIVCEIFEKGEPDRKAWLPSQGKKNRQTQSDDVPVVRVRFQYEKTGVGRFLSHLDLIRIFYRAFRSAGIPVLYSQGFNPHPRFSFSPPLSLGYTSEAEYLDADLEGAVADDLGIRLSRYLPEGVRIRATGIVSKKAEALAAVINRSVFEVGVSLIAADKQDLEKSIRRLLELPSLGVERTVKGTSKNIDIRPYIDTIYSGNNTLFIRTKTIQSRTVRVEEILRELFPDTGGNIKRLPVHRKAQLIDTGTSVQTPMDIIS